MSDLLDGVEFEHIRGSMPAAPSEVDEKREWWHAQMEELVRLRRFAHQVIKAYLNEDNYEDLIDELFSAIASIQDDIEVGRVQE